MRAASRSRAARGSETGDVCRARAGLAQLRPRSRSRAGTDQVRRRSRGSHCAELAAYRGDLAQGKLDGLSSKTSQRVIAGPFAAMTLGTRRGVIKAERAGPAHTRAWGPLARGEAAAGAAARAPTSRVTAQALRRAASYPASRAARAWESAPTVLIESFRRDVESWVSMADAARAHPRLGSCSITASRRQAAGLRPAAAGEAGDERNRQDDGRREVGAACRPRRGLLGWRHEAARSSRAPARAARQVSPPPGLTS